MQKVIDIMGKYQDVIFCRKLLYNKAMGSIDKNYKYWTDYNLFFYVKKTEKI